MAARDWLVNDQGECQPRPSPRDWDLIRDRYYFHRFLTEIIDLLEQVREETEQWDHLPQIRLAVRQLITNSYWLQTQWREPDPKTGIGLLLLYDEIGYPLTVQTVTAAPGVVSPIHNHGTWGIVAVLQGQEKHTFWRRVPQPQFPDRIEPLSSQIFQSGEIVSFTPAAIHQVEAIGDRPTVSFNLYGDTQPRSRFEFEPTTHRAKLF
uniref:Cupin 2 domain-containing protein n=1 Tax=Cyanothece sp. (strain PCC 7425 / ATCC 29141) TaxID=395961 RepID=B8HUR7_CYAP4